MARKGLYPESVTPGIPKLGAKPEGWVETSYGQVLRIVQRPIHMDDNAEYQLVTAKRNRGGIVPRARLLGKEILTKTQFHIHSRDFLISKRQIIHGACGIVPDQLDGAIVSNEYTSMRVREGLLPEFLRYFCHTVFFQQTCFQASVGIDVEKMIFDAKEWLQHKVCLPSLPEQRKIADILGTWDEAIAVTERLIAAKRRRKQGLMQQLLTGKRRFAEFAREAWREVKLQEVSVINPPRPSSVADYTTVSFIAMADVSGEARVVTMSTRPFGEVRSGFTSFQNDDVIVAKITPCFENGKGALLRDLHNGIGFGSTEFHVIRAKQGVVQPEFVYYHTIGHAFRGEGASSMVGSAGQKRIPAEFIRCYSIPLPCLDEQERITSVLRSCDDEIALLTRKLALLQTQKKGLIQRLLSGQVRVTSLLEADLRRIVPFYVDLVKRRWIDHKELIHERIIETCRFFEIETIEESPSLQMAARQSSVRSPYSLAQIAWGKRVQQLAALQTVPEFTREKLLGGIPALLGHAAKPEDVARVPAFLSGLGVYFIILEHLPQTYLDGALLYRGQNPIIALTLRFDRLDSFWFTLMHELAHLVLGHDGVYLDQVNHGDDVSIEEGAANHQAEDWLIDRRAYERLRERPHLYPEDIEGFARTQERHPSIVAGRVRYETRHYDWYKAFDVSVRGYLEKWIDRT